MIKKIFIILTFIVSLNGWSDVQLKLYFPDTDIKVGNLQKATLELSSSALQSFEVQKLKGTNPGDLIYFYKISPLIRNNEVFTSEVHVIFLKKPEQDYVKFQIDSREINLTWNAIDVESTDAGQTLIFESFDVPARKKILLWMLVIFCVGAVVAGAFYIISRRRKSLAEKQKRKNIKEKILSARTYPEIVEVWQNKFFYQAEFPHISSAFKNFEKVFFQVSFKSSQNETEQEEVLKAYKTFINEVQEGFDGV